MTLAKRLWQGLFLACSCSLHRVLKLQSLPPPHQRGRSLPSLRPLPMEGTQHHWARFQRTAPRAHLMSRKRTMAASGNLTCRQ